MPGLTLHSSNRLETLMDKLAALLDSPLANPFHSEIILVQSRGMERWVSMELANRNGVCANCRFPFPNSFIGEIFGALLPPVIKDSPFAPEALCWKIMDALPRFLDKPAFAEIRNYLEEGPVDFKLFQLSRKIADVFDQYLLFRPEMVLGWEKGRGEAAGGWQAELWRELVGNIVVPHRAALLKKFLREAAKSGAPQALQGNFPARVSVFGISALPLFHLRALHAAAGFTDVHLFIMNPCREYWSEIVSGREITRITRKTKDEASEKDLHLEKGNSLLASMGKLGRDFFSMLQDLDCGEDADFIETGRDSLLHRVQSDILDLREGPPEKGPAPDSRPPDSSIEIHSCHSPLREVEVLQDNLLALFESRPDVRPRDVLVMTPDIESYAPFIEAVFSLPEGDPRMVPFSIADKGMKVESRVVSSFLGLLELPAGRFGAGRVMAVLESEDIRERFSLTGPDVEAVRGWVRAARIRWGLDREHREALGMPGFAQNTWRAGLDRMLLGYALPEKDGALFAGTLPFDGIEGGVSEVLGRFLDFVEKLFTAAGEMKRERTLVQWSDFLAGMIKDFFPERSDLSPDLRLLKGAVDELKKFGEALRREVGIDIIREHLKRRLDMEGFGGGFLAGGITFCAMLPMRSIPFKVICLIGMDDGAYPRETIPPGFDLMAKDPRPGDRSRRLDDRYLFLETLLSAREKLYLSYVGQDIRDNSPRPPSVLVSELLDYLASGYGMPDFTVKHALQAFSPVYFAGKKLFSYLRENFAAAGILADRTARQHPAPGFFTGGLSDPGAEFHSVSVDDLCRFFTNPAKFILNKRLGVFLEERADVLDEREPFAIEGLDRYELERNLLAGALQGRDIRGELERFRAGGLIPPGTPGACCFEETCSSIERLAGRVKGLRAGDALEPFRVDLSLSGFRVTGEISGLYPGGFILHRARSSKRSLVTFWIMHLVLDCEVRKTRAPAPALSALCTGDLDCVYRCPEDSLSILGQLLLLYRDGLKKPTPFFPKASWAYAEAVHKGKDNGLEKARDLFEGNDFSRGEIDDPYVKRCFSGPDHPLDGPEFAEIAVNVIGPALEHGEFEEQ